MTNHIDRDIIIIDQYGRYKNGGGVLTGRFDLFHSLEEEKKTRIINAAMEEFAEKGFKRASTNSIVERAGISKGMLFYYFGSKEELFDFLFEYTMEFGKSHYLRNLSGETGDFLERCIKLTEIKRQVLSDFPLLGRFLESLYLPENQEHFKKYQKGADEIYEGVRKKLYDDLDYSLFREDIAPKNTVRYIKWLMDAYEADLMTRLKSGNLDAMDETAITNEWKRFYSFVEDLRKIFYKER